MNPSYYGKTGPHGYQAHHLSSSAPMPNTTSSSVYPNGEYNAYAGFRNATQAAFDYNRNVIPGLGLNMAPQVAAPPISQSTVSTTSSTLAPGILQPAIPSHADAKLDH